MEQQAQAVTVARPLRVERVGRVAYGPMLARQETTHAAVADGSCPDTLFLLEHEPVITTGRNTGENHILWAPDALAAAGVELFHTGRGGDVTYHGPGQIVGYPIVQLQPKERDIKGYVWRLEQAMIDTAADFGVPNATRIEGLRGIWVGNDKLAAIGVRLSRWTTMHGFAFNVSVDLAGFGRIVPCGLHGRGVTSLARLLGDNAPTLEAVEERLAHHVAGHLGREAE